jgi:hypothetical protein
VVRVASNWLTMVQSRQALLEKAMLLALGSSRQVTLEASHHPPAHPAAAGPPASASAPATPRVEGVSQQPQTLQPLAAVAIPATPASSEPQAPIEPTRQPPPTEQPAHGAPQASAPPILGRLETSTRLLADFFQGDVIESNEADTSQNSGELEKSSEAPIETIQAP